jgi:hypothetical protein
VPVRPFKSIQFKFALSEAIPEASLDSTSIHSQLEKSVVLELLQGYTLADPQFRPLGPNGILYTCMSSPTLVEQNLGVDNIQIAGFFHQLLF